MMLSNDSFDYSCDRKCFSAVASVPKPVPNSLRYQPYHAHQTSVVGFMRTTETDENVSELLNARAPVETMKDKLMRTPSFRQFQSAIQRNPSLHDDWLSFTSRTWVQGPVDAFFGNPYLAAMMKDNKSLEQTVGSIIATGDHVLQQGDYVPWLYHVVKTVGNHSGIYILIEALEEMLGPHRVARLEQITNAALTRPRAVKIVAVLAALLTPQTLDNMMILIKTCFTDERINRMMDAAEYVISDEDRLVLADLALDQLSDAVPDDGVLHMLASLDAAADVELLLQTGQELLSWLLEDPESMGENIGWFIDQIVDMDRVKRAVARNDEVMTLERISIMGKVLAQLSPVMQPGNISAAMQWSHDALASHRLQGWAGEAVGHILAQDLRSWWSILDRALSPDVVLALLHLVESLLDGGRVWAAMGQPQPMLEMLLLADEEARAATCKSACGNQSREGSPAASMDSINTSSRDDWNRSPLPASDDNANKTLAEAAAAAAAAAASAAAAAASVAPACAIGDKSCQACSDNCGSPVDRMFASGAHLSDPDLQELIRHYLSVCRQPRRQQQRKVAEQAAQLTAVSAFTAAGLGGVVPTSVLSSASSHLWSTDGMPLSSLLDADHLEGETALNSAATAAAAAAAVAAAAAASGSSACNYNSAPVESARGSSPAPVDTSVAAESSVDNQFDEQQQRVRHNAVSGAVAAARALLQPRPLQQLLALLPDLLAPQRVAVAMAVLDNKLKIGEHEVSLGPNCEVNPTSDSSSSDSSNKSIMSSSSNAAVSHAALALLSLPRLLPQQLLDRSVAAAADVAAAAGSKQQLLHAVDTLIAIWVVDEYAKTQQQQQQQQPSAGKPVSMTGSGNLLTEAAAAVSAAFQAAQMAVSHPHTGVLGHPVVVAAGAAAATAAPAARSRLHDALHRMHCSNATTAAAAAAAEPVAVAAAAQQQLYTAGTVLSCALGNARDCVQLELDNAPNASAGRCCSSGSSSSSKSYTELLATLIGLHVALAGDLWKLWWSYHTNLVLRMCVSPAA